MSARFSQVFLCRCRNGSRKTGPLFSNVSEKIKVTCGSRGFATVPPGKSGHDKATSGAAGNTASASTATAVKADLNAGETQRTRVPLDVPLTLDEGVQSKYEKLTFDTKLTTLDNGYRVASQDRYGRYCTVGVAVKSGSRYESKYTKGLSHVIEKMGFMTSRAFPNREAIMKELEVYGAICDSQTSRDTTVYAISCERRGLRRMVELLSECLLRPQLTEEELTNARAACLYEMEDIEMKPEQEPVLLEMIHSAAWDGNTMGNPRFCPPENTSLVTRQELLKFLNAHVSPGRTVVTGVGVDHKELVDLTKEYFQVGTATWDVEGVAPGSVGDESAVYVGGERRVEKDFAQFNAGPSPVPKLAHIAIGLESVSHSSPHFITACVLNILMGGGGSFSAGGPGKGMYSRLYTNVLNSKLWVYNVTAYNNSYVDSGVFCIYGCAPPEYLGNLTEVIMKELHLMAGSIGREELQRAKTQLKSMLLMNLESRPVLFEDIGRQVLAHGQHKSPATYLKLIDAVDEGSIRELARIMLKSKPCLAALGNLTKLPALSQILTINGTLTEQAHFTSKRFLFTR